MVHTGGAYPQQFGAATPSSLGLVRPAVWGCCFEMCTSTRHELFQQPDLKNRQTCFFSVFSCELLLFVLRGMLFGGSGLLLLLIGQQI